MPDDRIGKYNWSIEQQSKEQMVLSSYQNTGKVAAVLNELGRPFHAWVLSPEECDLQEMIIE